MMLSGGIREYFDARCERGAETDCWEWRGSVARNGYGRAWFSGTNTMAHRLSYEIHVGPIPADMTIDHLCFNTLCVNPAHLSVKSRVENAKRQRSAMRTHCKNGHEFSTENTYPRGDRGEGQRDCRVCIRTRSREYQRRRRQSERSAA